MDDCGICCEGFNKSNHKKVDCPFCDLKVCRVCVQRYLLDTSNDAHCMGCKNAWGREIVDDACTKTFRNKQFKEHRETILMERQRCLMPETQPLVERRLRARVLENDLVKVNNQIQALYIERRQLEDNIFAAKWDRSLGPAKEKREFVRKCPVEDCRGFLSTAWKCGICDNKICPDCNEVKCDDHECDPANVETVKLLKKDTKPCPKCGTLIFKISGCSQMWCPDCHTAFCWNTMRIETGVIHNPHYYDFQRCHGTRGRNHGDIPCGGLPTIYELRPILKKQVNSEQVYNIHRGIVHLLTVEMRYNYPEPLNGDTTVELRIQYLLNEIDEDYMKCSLQKREKAASKLRDVRGILQMVTDTGSDLLRQMVLEPATIDDTIDIFKNLKEYYNSAVHKISSRYNCVVPLINDAWYVLRVKP